MTPTPKPHPFPHPLRTWLISALLLICALNAQAQKITLNLQDADIRALINTVAEVTNTNFIIDPRVAGKVTVISVEPMDVDALYDVFLSILDVHGFSAVGSGQVIKIIPNVNAKTSGVVAGTSATPVAGGDIVTEIIEIKNMPAQQLLPALRPLVPQYAHLAAFPNSNILLLSDHAYNVERIKALIAKIDVATQINTEVVVLENASADELSAILTTLQSGTGNNLQGVQFVGDSRSNSILLGGDLPGRIRMRGIIAHLDMPTGEQSNTHVVYLNFASAEDIVPILAGTIPTTGKDGDNGITVQADSNTNSVIITAPPPAYNDLRQVIRKLDVRRAQVLVEAIIADVSAGTADELGVQWVIDGRDGGYAVGATNFANGRSSITNILAGAESGIPILDQGLSLALGNFGSGGTNFAALLRALSSDATTNILSTPSVMTLDNQEAEILVGQSVPFITGQYTDTGAGGGSVDPFQTIQREDVGVTLRVKPQINEGSTIKLELHQEVSSVIPSIKTLGASDLVTNKRSINTTVLVDSNETIVLGGLIDDQLITTDERVPFLGSVPILGRLFRYQSTDVEKRQLMVFIKPQIVRDKADARSLTGGKYQNMRASQLKQRLQAEQIFPGNANAAVLPELNVFTPAEGGTTQP
ncbi:MAG: type II secretion system protein GspD [Gammaproteobacteria bacterium]|nr:MAG: type II secretion system protein GspD [Gammaproteobacteria bacterium]RLA14780.1 MAG: type II secretion system protein GspD [Gammaproteobacteria bacterium]RLA18163.1 MAG: type II secretion system protein GspD [Gammaproteobacteria bacterium]